MGEYAYKYGIVGRSKVVDCLWINENIGISTYLQFLYKLKEYCYFVVMYLLKWIRHVGEINLCLKNIKILSYETESFPVKKALLSITQIIIMERYMTTIF